MAPSPPREAEPRLAGASRPPGQDHAVTRPSRGSSLAPLNQKKTPLPPGGGLCLSEARPHPQPVRSFAALCWRCRTSTTRSAPNPLGLREASGRPPTDLGRDSTPSSGVDRRLSFRTRGRHVWSGLGPLVSIAIVLLSPRPLTGTRKMEYKGSSWHETCFICHRCQQPIGTKSFIPKDGQNFCVPCYERQYALQCVQCKKVPRIPPGPCTPGVLSERAATYP